jgi:hypothetical protein
VLSTENVDEAVKTESAWETVGDSGSRFDPSVMAAAVLRFIVIYFVETN